MTIIASGLTSPNTSANNQRKIAVASDGTLYMCFHANVSSYNQIFVYKSVDKGISWIDMGFPHITGYNQENPSMVIDNNDKLHIVWQGIDSTDTTFYQIKYCNNISGNWSVYENVQLIVNKYQQKPSIAIDSNDKLHVVWHGQDNVNGTKHQIKYSNNINGTWSNWINIQTISGYTQNSPSIVVDSNDKLHVVWYGTDNSNVQNQIKYSNNITGTWSNWINIHQSISDYTQSNPSLDIDLNNKCHVVWQEYDSANTIKQQIKYSNNINGNWSVSENIQTINGYMQYYPSISIDLNNKCHVVWRGTDSINTTKYQLKYSNNINGDWSNYENKTNSGTIEYSYPSTIYKNNNLYCVYQSFSSTVEFFNIQFISYKHLIKSIGLNKIQILNTSTNLWEETPVADINNLTQADFETYGVDDLTAIGKTQFDSLKASGTNSFKVLTWKG